MKCQCSSKQFQKYIYIYIKQGVPAIKVIEEELISSILQSFQRLNRLDKLLIVQIHFFQTFYIFFNILSVNQELAQLSEEQFEKVKLSYYKDQSQDFQNLNEKFKDFWNEILINQNDFDKKQKLKERIDSITHEKFMNFALNIFKDSKRLEIHIVNQKHLDWELEYQEKISNCEWHEDVFQLN